MEFPASKRATLGELSQDRREVVREALECNCSVEQTAFEFADKDRIEVVRDGDQWYFLRVVIV